jgi:hypothetical protein
MSSAASTQARGYDRVTILDTDGARRSVSRAEYEKLPLAERIRLLLQDRVEFYQDGTLVPANQALKVS